MSEPVQPSGAERSAAQPAPKVHPLGKNAAAVAELFKCDPTKEVPNQDAFTAALAEINKERSEKLKTKAKEQLVKAVELMGKMATLRKQFDAEYAKVDKELGKLLNGIKGVMNGKSVEDIEAEAAAEEKKDA